MQEQFPFIGRERELSVIEAAIREKGTRRIIFLDGEGGIGKTRLLMEIYQRYCAGRSGSQSPLLVTEIIDFDDDAFRDPQYLGRQMAEELGRDVFQDYLENLQNLQRMKNARVSYQSLMETSHELDQIFINCFNRKSENIRILLFRDTLDHYGKPFDQLSSFWSQYQNCVILVAGRNLKAYADKYQEKHPSDGVKILELKPFSTEESISFLQHKEKQLSVSLEPFTKKISFLTGGKPILLDLAAEGITRQIPLDWVLKNGVSDLASLPENLRLERSKEFERYLVTQYCQSNNALDWLVLILAHIFPLDIHLAARLLSGSEQETEIAYNRAKERAFIKSLPNGYITLHEVMRQMIMEYVWDELDYDKGRRKDYSQIALDYLEEKSLLIRDTISQVRAWAADDLDQFLRLGKLDKDYWLKQAQRLFHSFYVGPTEGLHLSAELFDEARGQSHYSFCKQTIDRASKYISSYNDELFYQFASRAAEYSLDTVDLDAGMDWCNQLFSRPLTVEQKAHISILQGNILVRQGKTRQGIEKFTDAVNFSSQGKAFIWKIRSFNGLGWAYRLIGDRSKAIKYYQQAKDLCLENDEYGEDYGWILNNLTFMTSYIDRRSAIGFGHLAVQHWERIGNLRGAGAAYQALGSVYYQDGLYDKSREAFDEAMKIFTALPNPDWEGIVRAWRGALYQDLNRLDEAEDNLKTALRLCSRQKQFIPMILTRLGRVLMSRAQKSKDASMWDKAQEYLWQGYREARAASDYLYWIGALGRLMIIAAEKREYQTLESWEKELNDYLQEARQMLDPDEIDANSIGICHFNLGRLSLGLGQMSKAIDYFQQGISEVTEYGSYAHTDIRDRLEYVEADFSNIPTEVIEQMSRELLRIFREKEKNLPAYGVVTPILFRWTRWSKEHK